jgi:tetratricopeptide (TPR) repeat protein
MASIGIEPHECACIFCLDSDPPPIQSGCACRSDTGLAHVGCLIEKAVAQQPHRSNAVWWECQTCGQKFTGPMRTGLAEAWWLRVCDEAEESFERLAAADNLAAARSGQGQYAEAERIEREVLGVKRRVLGEEHPVTLTSAGNLAHSLSRQRKYAAAERIEREVLGVQRRVLGDEHPDTLASAGNLAGSLFGQGKHAEAERIEREVLGARRRILGEEHPDTLTSASNLAKLLWGQGKYVEAEEMLQAVLAAFRRVLGSAHPNTLATAESLESLRSRMRAKQPTKRGDKAAARKERAAASPLSPTALAEAEARAGLAEAELLAMLELEEARVDGESRGKAKGKAKGKASKR